MFDVLEIGLFQLENLASTPTQFTLIDLSKTRPELPEELSKLLLRARRVRPADFLKEDLNGQLPVVLVCESGRRSRKTGRILAKRGLQNVCVLGGGFKQMIKEFGQP